MVEQRIANLGYLCMEGVHVSLHVRHGREMLLAAARMDEPRAQYTCGVALLRGDWNITNNAEALTFLRSAAEQGIRGAQKLIADTLARTNTPYRSLWEAWKWYEIARIAGDRDSAAGLDSLWREITAEEIAQARREVAAYKPKRKGPSPYLTMPGVPPLQNSPFAAPSDFTLPVMPSLLDRTKTVAR